MTRLMGLLLGASPHRRQELARRWSVEGRPDTGYLVANLYRRITDEWFLRSFLDQLPPEQLMALEQIIGEPAGRLPLAELLRRLPLDEARAQSAGTALAQAGLLIVESGPPCLVVPEDLLPLLRRMTWRRGETDSAGRAAPHGPPGAAEAAAWRRRLDASRGAVDSGTGAAAAHHLAPLIAVGEPETLAAAGDPLLEDIGRLLEVPIRGVLTLPPGAGDDWIGPATASPGRVAPRGDRWAAARTSYALRCAAFLGLLRLDEGKGCWAHTPAVRAWRALDREQQARAVYEIWLSDRQWQEPMARRGAGRGRQPLPRFDRLRQRLRLWLAEARPGEWYSVRSLLGRARCAPAAGPGAPSARDASRRSAGASAAGAVVAVLTAGFHWLGGVDVGGDAAGRASSFRLTARGSRLLGRTDAGTAVTGDAARTGRQDV